MEDNCNKKTANLAVRKIALPAKEKNSEEPGASKLSHLRQQIDVIDSEIAALLANRYCLVLEIAKLKTTLGIPRQVCHREEEILTRVTTKVKDADAVKFITNVYKEILKESRAAQAQNNSG